MAALSSLCNLTWMGGEKKNYTVVMVGVIIYRLMCPIKTFLCSLNRIDVGTVCILCWA